METNKNPKEVEMPEVSIPLDALTDEIKKQEKKLSVENKNEELTITEKGFPISVFPEELQKIIKEFYKSFQLPLDYFGLGILVVGSAAIGNAYCLRYKPGYEVSAIVYGAVVGSSSIGKTPVLKRCLAPLFEIEKEYDNDYKERLAQNAEDVEQGISKSNLIKRKDIIINNSTTEGIVRSLSNNPKGVLLYQDELAAWIKNLNQYRKGGDQEFWIETWNNSPTKTNRATQDTIFVPKPFVSVIGGLQPSTLPILASNGKKDNGFLYRILFAYPAQQKKPYETDYEVEQEIFSAYKEIISRLHNLPNNITQNEDLSWEIESIPLALTPEAKSAYQKWNRANTDSINESHNESVKSLFGKLENYCLRFSLILELLQCVCESKKVSANTQVNKETMLSAIQLTEYFRSTGLKVLDILEDEDPLKEHPTDKQKLYEALPNDFTTAQGLSIAKEHNISERTFKRFLQKKNLFDRYKRGFYSKLL